MADSLDTPRPASFDDRLSAGLHRDADALTGFRPDPDALAARGRRLRARRRWTQGGLAAVVAVVAVAGATQLGGQPGLNVGSASGVATVAAGGAALATPTSDVSQEIGVGMPAGPPQDMARYQLLGTWVLTSASGTPQALLADHPVYATFGRGGPLGAQVDGACGSLAAPSFAVQDGRLRLDDAYRHETGCAGAERIQDDWVWALLTQRPTVEIDGGRLTLATHDAQGLPGDVTVTAERLDGPDTPLVGDWRITQASGTPQKLLSGQQSKLSFGASFADGGSETFSAGIGACLSESRYGYAIRSGRLVLGTPGPIPTIGCATEVFTQTEWLRKLLISEPKAVLEGDRLTLTGSGMSVTAIRRSETGTASSSPADPTPPDAVSGGESSDSTGSGPLGPRSAEPTVAVPPETPVTAAPVPRGDTTTVPPAAPVAPAIDTSWAPGASASATTAASPLPRGVGTAAPAHP